MNELVEFVADLIVGLVTTIASWARCVYDRLSIFVSRVLIPSFAIFFAFFLVGLLLFVVLAAVSGQWELVSGYAGAMLLVAVIGFGMWFVTELLAIMVSCTFAVLQDAVAAAASGMPGAVGALIASGAVNTCREAEALLARAQTEFEAARSARDRQAQRVTAARTGVGDARGMIYAASASTIAAVWQPWTLVAALAALAAAVVLLARRSRELADQIALSALREAELLRALAEVAAAEALAATQCGALPTARNGVDPGLLAGGPVPVSSTMP